MVDMGPTMPTWDAALAPMRSMAIITMSTGAAVHSKALSTDSHSTSGATRAADSGRSRANCSRHNTQATLVASPPGAANPGV